MNKLLYLILLALCVSSCARILNSEDKYISVHTPESSQIIYGPDTISTVDNRAIIKAPRQEAPVKIQVETDSLSKEVDIYSSDSFLYWSNLLFNYGIGILFDLEQPKRYKYPEDVYLETSDSLNYYSIFGKPKSKGRLYFNGSVSVLNHLLFKPDFSSSATDVSSLGVGFGGDYFYSDNKFIHLGVDVIYDFDLLTSLLFDEREMYSAITYSLSHQVKKKRCSYGLGFSLRENYYTTFRMYSSLGLTVPFHYQLSNYWHVGLVYNPTFYRPQLENQWAYDHTINIQFVCKVRVDY